MSIAGGGYNAVVVTCSQVGLGVVSDAAEPMGFDFSMSLFSVVSYCEFTLNPRWSCVDAGRCRDDAGRLLPYQANHFWADAIDWSANLN